MKMVYSNNNIQQRRIVFAIVAFMFAIALTLLCFLVLLPELGEERATTEVTITAIEDYYDGDGWTYIAYGTYTVDGVTYNNIELPSYSSNYYVGKVLTVYYLVNDPSTLISPGANIIAFIAFSIFSVLLFGVGIKNLVSVARRKANTEANPQVVDNVVKAVEQSDNPLTYANKPTINSAYTLYFHKHGKNNKDYIAESMNHKAYYNITKLSRNSYEFHNVETGSRRTYTISGVKIKEFGNSERNVNIRSFKIDDVDALEFLSKRGVTIESHIEDLNWFDVKYYNSSIAYIEERALRNLFDLNYHNYSFVPTPGSYKIDLDIDEIDNVMLSAFTLSLIITTHN
jgi:hypothetical protein